MSALKYRPEIDGLRAVAILPVVLFHLGFGWIAGGFLGVDVFFVISGFLITSILVADLEAGSFRFRAFWARRIRRIAPALLVMVLVTLAASYWLVYRPGLDSYGGDALAAVLSYANVAMYLKVGNYWGAAAESSPFLHAWSLSLEEQFYFLYPVVLLGLWKLGLNRGHLLLLVIAVSLGLFGYSSIRHPVLCFYLLPTRAWELACGGFVAVILPSVMQRAAGWRSGVALAGLVAIIVGYFLGSGSQGISDWTVIPVLGASAVVLCAAPGSMVTRWLSLSPVVYLGRLSYSIYLWHWPVIVLAKAYAQRCGRSPSPVAMVGLIAVFSLVSYYGVEKPTRKMVRVVPLAAGLLGVVLLASLWLVWIPLPKYDVSQFHQVVSHVLAYDVTPTIGPVSKRMARNREGVLIPGRQPGLERAFADSGVPGRRSRGRAPEILVLGDSHAGMWANTLDEIGTELDRSIWFFPTVGNNPFFAIPLQEGTSQGDGFSTQESGEYQRNILAKIREAKPKLVIIASRWSIRNDADMEHLRALLLDCRQYGVKTLLLNQPPELFIGDNNSSQYLAFLGMQPLLGRMQVVAMADSAKVRARNLLAEQACWEAKLCRVFDVASAFIQAGQALVLDGADVLYFDDDHLSSQGTQRLKSRLKQAVAEQFP